MYSALVIEHDSAIDIMESFLRARCSSPISIILLSMQITSCVQCFQTGESKLVQVEMEKMYINRIMRSELLVIIKSRERNNEKGKSLEIDDRGNGGGRHTT